jgi:hypothetical protein
MANEFDNTIYSSFQRSFIAPPEDRTARTDTLTDAALSACRADCDTTWKTNWYQQQVDLWLAEEANCKKEADDYRRDQYRGCDSYGDSMTRGMCYREVAWAYGRVLNQCVAQIPGKVPGLAGYPTVQWFEESLYPSWAYSTITINADKKSTVCKNKNCR